MRYVLAVMGAFVMSFFGFGKPAKAADSRTLYDFTLTAIDGQPMPLSAYRGRVVLLVNTASFCGFTRQYAGLETLYKTYRDKGLVIIGVPSNDFGAQEPGSSSEIKQFCDANFSIEFPLADKSAVVGENAIPLYAWLRVRLGDAGMPRWNFHKYLIGRDGQPIDWFASITGPDTKVLVSAIEKALAAGAAPPSGEPAGEPAPVTP